MVERVEQGGHKVLAWTWSMCVRILLVPLAGLASWIRSLDWTGRIFVVVVPPLVAGFLIGPRVERFGCGPRYPWLEDDVEALARVIRSEIGVGSEQQKLHVAWVTRNLAADRGQTIAEMACQPCGPQEKGRPVSSRQAANDRDRALARLVIEADPRLDPTGGATHFINPALQDELARRKVPGYRGRPYSSVRRTWMKSYGWEPYYRLGPDLEMWGDPR